MEQGTVNEIVRDVRSGSRTALQVAEASLAAIRERDRRIGAFVAVDEAAVRRDAGAVDAHPRRADLPLAGVPVAVKDNFDVAGMPSRRGSLASTSLAAAKDDLVIARLRASGAVVVGKTQMPELAIWPWTESPFGVTRNPRDLARNAGGSTGGGAAAVAAGMAAIAVGTDGGGSIRVPSANVGLVGLKPAPGTLPLPADAATHWYGLTATGLIARTVEDVEMALAAITGEAPTGPTGARRLAVSLRSPTPLGRPDPAARAGLDAAARLLLESGLELERTDPPYPRDLIARWGERWLAGIAEDVGELGLDPAALEPRTRAALRRGRRIERQGGPTDDAMDRWREAAARFFETVDVLVTPTIARPAPPAGASLRRGFLHAYLDAGRRTPYTEAWNLAGYPAVTVPLGFGHGGALSAQIIAPRLERVLEVARRLEAGVVERDATEEPSPERVRAEPSTGPAGGDPSMAAVHAGRPHGV
jgi:amidase